MLSKNEVSHGQGRLNYQYSINSRQEELSTESLRREKISKPNPRRGFLRWAIVSAIMATLLPLSDGLTKVAALAKNEEKPNEISQDSTNEVSDPDQYHPECCVPVACPSGVCYNNAYPVNGCAYGGGYGPGYCAGSGGGYSGCEGGVSPKQRTGWKPSWSEDGRPQ
ncbi:MAG: hypothetical protein ACLPY5_07495 [Candidatus Bathyarchaeia archaeon]